MSVDLVNVGERFELTHVVEAEGRHACDALPLLADKLLKGWKWLTRRGLLTRPNR